MMQDTPDKKPLRSKEASANEIFTFPSNTSVSIIKQFARVYYVAPELKIATKDFIRN